MTLIPPDTPLKPGTYAMPLLSVNGRLRAVLDVPAGYVAWLDGRVIGSAEDEANPDEYADAGFWGRVTRVDTDPCLGGRHVRAGTQVRDLVARLAALRHMTVSRPVGVTIGGYHGVHLRLTAPRNIDRCRDDAVTILTDGDVWLQQDAPGAIFDEWILDVDGHRVVAVARISPGFSHSAELRQIVETARFTGAGR